MTGKIAAIIAGMILSTSNFALAISVGTFGTIDDWVTSASRVSGSGGEYAGVDPVNALVGDDLTDGAINIGLSGTDSFLLTFSSGITNSAGNDFVVFDGRFSSDGIAITVNGTERQVLSSSFTDSGLDLILKNTSYTFDLYGAALDLSDWGVQADATVYDIVLTSYYSSEADIMGVGVLQSTPVPEPTTMFLFGTGIAGLVAIGRKRR